MIYTTELVYQDGADFYRGGIGDEETGAFIVSAPFKVFDFDMDAADRARTWFVETYCPANSILPTFVSYL